MRESYQLGTPSRQERRFREQQRNRSSHRRRQRQHIPPRQHHRATTARESDRDSDASDYESDDNLPPEPGLQQPSMSRKKRKFWLTCIRWQLAAVCIPLLVSIGFAVAFARITNIQNFNDKDYSLYKNSRFAECVDLNAGSGLNCTSRYNLIFKARYSNATKISWGQFPSDGDANAWCEFVGCLQDYQVLPSVPKPGAMIPSILFMWLGYSISAAFSIYGEIKSTDFETHMPEHCPERGCIMWASTLGSLVMMIWWWVVFARIGTSPAAAYSASPLSWITTWTMANAFSKHPIYCVFHRRRKLQRAIWASLSIMTFAQLCASFHLIKFYLYNSHFYDFLPNEYTRLSGTDSACSAIEIMRDDVFFFGFEPYEGVEEHQASLFLTIIIVLSMGSALSDNLSRIGRLCTYLPFKFEVEPRLPRLAGAMGGVLRSLLHVGTVGWFTYLGMRTSIYYLQDADREAPLSIDVTCKVVHVGLSAWRHGLDTYGNNRALRLVQGFLGIGY